MADGAGKHPIRSRLGGRNFADLPDHPEMEGSPAPVRRQDPDQKGKFKVAFSGEEYGFGYRALIEYGAVAKSRDGRVPDAGGHGLRRAILPQKLDFDSADRQPLRTKEQTLTAVATEKADFALVPFYSPDSGYDTESIDLLSKLFSPLGVDQIAAGDQFCLAVYESQVLELAQASLPGSAMSRLLTGRRHLAALDPGVQWSGGRSLSGGEGASRALPASAAAIQPDADSQIMLRDRIAMVFAGPEATRRCKSKLDGLRAAGVSVEETLQWVEPHREMARRVRDTLDKDRQTQTFMDPMTGRPMVASLMSARAQTQPLFGVILPYEVAYRSPEFIIVDPAFDDSSTQKTRYLLCEKNYDHTLFEDRYKFAQQRVPVWKKRLFSTGLKFGGLRTALANPILYGRLALEFVLLQSRDKSGDAHNLDDVFDSQDDHHDASLEKPSVRVLIQIDHGRKGVESIGRLEKFLRYFGVRYATVRMVDDSTDLGPRRGPSPLILDIEFDRRDFLPHPQIGSVVEGFLWETFNISRFGMPRFLAVMPARDHQLADVAQRRWWNEGVDVAAHAIAEKFEAALGFVLSWPFKALFIPAAAFVIKPVLFWTVVAPGLFFGYHPASKAFLPSWTVVAAGLFLLRDKIGPALNWLLEILPTLTF